MKRLALLVLSVVTVGAQGQSLPAVLAKLDAVSAGFKSAQADVSYDTYTAAAHAHDQETGRLFVERSGKSDSMGAITFAPGSKTPAKVILYDGGTLRMYSPGANQVDQFKAGANQAKYESFLTLGFGGSGKSLAANWNITDKGAKTIGGVNCEELDLKAKDPSVANMFDDVVIWVDLTRGVSVRQVFHQPGGDSRTAEYTNIRVGGGKLDKSGYSIPKSANVIPH